jgi:hypothetical protein
MAQAFEIPMETGQRPGHTFLPDGILTSSGHAFQIAVPGRPTHPLDR